MDNNLKPGPKAPRGRRSGDAMAKRALRLAGIRHTAFAQAQVAKAHTELDKRTSKVVTLEAKVVRQAETVRAAAAKLREVRAQVSTARPLSALSRTHPPTPRCAALPEKHTGANSCRPDVSRCWRSFSCSMDRCEASGTHSVHPHAAHSMLPRRPPDTSTPRAPHSNHHAPTHTAGPTNHPRPAVPPLHPPPSPVPETHPSLSRAAGRLWPSRAKVRQPTCTDSPQSAHSRQPTGPTLGNLSTARKGAPLCLQASGTGGDKREAANGNALRPPPPRPSTLPSHPTLPPQPHTLALPP